MKADIRDYFDCTLGRKSHLNLAGKIVLGVVIVAFGVVYFTLDALFTKHR